MVRRFPIRRLLALFLLEWFILQPFQLARPQLHAMEPADAYARAASEATAPAEAARAEEAAELASLDAVSAADTAGLEVFVGFADSTSPSASFPTPWQGAPNVTYMGGGAPVNAGAVRLDNVSGVPVTVEKVTVDLQRANAQFSLWPSFTIPAGGSAILTQTLPGNFDTSAYPIVACGGALPAGETRIPKITVRIDGSDVSVLDTAHVLDTGGFDSSCRGNESVQWRAVGTRGIDFPGGELSLGPSGLSGSGGSPVTLRAHLQDANGTPLANVVADFRAISGPNAGESGQGVTDSQGNARFTYVGTAQGADVVRASVANASGAAVLSNDVTVTWETASCGPDVPLPPSGEASLLYIGGTRVQYSDPLELAALLTDATGAPVAGRTLTFSLGGEAFTAVTDATGVARIAVTANAAPAEVPVTVDFAGEGNLPALRATQTVTVEREDVLLEYTAKTLLGTAVPQPVSARLRDPDSLAPLAGKTVTFSVGGVTATAVTNANGVASTTITLGPQQLSGPSSLTVAFAGDTFYEPAFRTVAVTLYLSTSFVIWGGNDAGLELGQRVNFWGAQWESQVLQGEYATNPSFKGLADPIDQIHICQPDATARSLTPTCWISKGGQTFPPPISVPAYIEVIVSTAIAKDGNDIYGNIAAAAVVKVDPQPPYGPDPGKPGYGVIVAVIEDSGIFPAPAVVTAAQTQPRTVLPNQQLTIKTTVANASASTAATQVALSETLDGLSPETFSHTFGTLPAGGSQAVELQATTPDVPTRESTETAAEYLQRLAALNGRVFTAAGKVTFSDANGQVYLPVEVSSRSVLAIPVLTLALSGPAVASPGSPAPYKVTVTNVGSAPATATIHLTLPDGTTRTLDVADLAAGSSFVQIETFTPAAIAPKGENETTAEYLARLAEADGQILTVSAELSWTDAIGNPYGDVGQRLFTSRIRVPILSFTTEVPATLLPAQTADVVSQVRNTGGCTAVLSNLQVTNPDGTVTSAPPFVLGAGESTTITTTWRVPEIPKRDDDGETDAQYQARLASFNNRDLDFGISLDWSDPAGAPYGPTSGEARSKEILSIVPLTLTAPATAAAGTTIAYTVGAANVGAAAAPEVDLAVKLPDGSIVKPAVGSLAPGASFQTTINYAIPSTQPAGVITAEAMAIWTDPGHNAYGPLSAAASTDVTNVTVFNSLVLAPAIAGPNVTGTSQTMTATLKDPAGVPIAGATVQFTVTGVNPGGGTGTTDASGNATFSYTGANAGADTVQATSGSAVSNTATVNWIIPVQSISTTPIFARYFFSNGSGVFNTPAGTTPAFIQAFPTINFNPPTGTIPGNTSGVGVNTRPFTNVTTDLNGNFTGTIIAEGNGLQAGVGSLFTFQAVYTGSFTVAGAGNLVISFFSDDGFIFGVGGGATRVSGPLLNVPAGGLTPFESLPVMGAYNSPTAPVANTIVVNFPAAGSYPYEVDYSECCAGQLALTVTAGNVSNHGVPPTGSLKLSPLTLTAKPTGQAQTLTVEAFDGSGLPVANAGLALIVNGPNAREISAVTDAAGRATFSYIGVNAGTDTAQAVGRVAGLGTFSNVVNVPWTVGTGGGDPNQPPGNIGPVVTQGWIGGPLIGSTVQTSTPITVASGISITSGILDFWPSSNPAEIRVLNGNVVGGGTMATLDPSVLANGEYTIRLRATLSNGTQQTSLIVVEVTGENKPGRVTKLVTDLRVPVAGMPVTISRRYDSLERGKVGDFGYGWSLLTSVRLEVNKKNDVTFNFNGRRQTFQFKPQNAPFPFPFFLFPKWVPEPGSYGTLTGDGCGLLILSGGTFACFLDVPGSFAPSNYTYTDPYGRQYVIGADGQMKLVKDLNGNTLTFTRDGIVSSAGGLTVPFARDAQGRITQITDPAGNHYDYAYDAAGDLTAVQLPSIAAPVQYEYASGHLLVREIDPRGGSTSASYYPDGRLQSETDRTNNTTQYAYNLTANTVTSTYPDGGVTVRTNDSFGKPVSYKDQLNRVTTFTYDANHNLLTRTNALGKTWTYTYDANGNLTSSKDPLGNITRKNWDSRGRLLTVTDPLNQVKTFQYDGTGNITALQDSLGQLMGATYDAKGNQTSMTLPSGQTAQFAYNAVGNIVSIVDHSGFSSTHEWDGLGQLTAMVDSKHGRMDLGFDILGNQTLRRDPLGNTLAYTYDANGNRTGETDPNGNHFTHDYDASDRKIRTTFPDGTKVEMTYDFAGRLLSKKDESGVTERYVWDKAGQLTSIVSASSTTDAVTTSFTYDPAGRLNSVTDGRNNSTVFTYDDADRVKSMRDPAGRSVTFTYDTNNQVTAVTRADNVKRETRYDVRGRPTTFINPDGTSFVNTFDGLHLTAITSEDGRTTSYTYDNHSEIASVTDPGGNVTSYTRDEVGNVVSVRDPKGGETHYEYDAADRLVKKILPNGAFEQYTYDPDGHLATVRLPDGNVNRYTWDGRDRLGRIDYFDGNAAAFTYTPTGKRATATAASGVTSYAYDALDRLISITQPTGVVISYTYDAGDNITSITTPRGVSRYTYDNLNRLRTVTDPTGGVTTYTYDLGGRLTQRLLPNGVMTDYGYDSLDRLTSVGHHLGAAASFESFQYTLSPNGQRVSVREVNGTRTDWTYDDAYRLLRETVANASGTTVSELAYAYDQAGNRTSMTANGVTTIYQYNELDQLTSAGSAQYSYDDRGNLVRVTDGAATTTYSYDAANRLTQAAPTSGAPVSYAYDADGRLIRETSGATVRNFAWDELSDFGDIVYESTGAGASVASYTFGADEVVQRLGATPAYYLQDGLGSVIGLTNAAGAETDRYRYDAWGVRTLLQGSTPNPFAYRGQWNDDASGLLYLRARFFAPAVGRFLTRDTASFRLEDPIDLNRYTYAAANPINFYDPSGHSAAAEYGIIARQSAENATIEGYIVGRRAETLLSCALDMLMAAFVDGMLRGMIGAAVPNPLNGRRIWKGLPNVITVAFGWIVKAPVDVPGPDYLFSPATEAGRKVLLEKAAVYRAAPRELAWAMSGFYVNALFKLLGQLAELIAGIDGVFLGNDQNLADKCSNHAERKIVRHANPPANALLSVGASRPVCANCRAELIPKVVIYGGCIGPIGTGNQCRP
ncbi:MAG TPA: Ig-like domain-containing protein [Thermoanaerobaculia bacterium]|jgi:RHS repeat-associated protein|nr:Ig-like domain-containing protein [Thermoanaerobaculia bacterium]